MSGPGRGPEPTLGRELCAGGSLRASAGLADASAATARTLAASATVFTRARKRRPDPSRETVLTAAKIPPCQAAAVNGPAASQQTSRRDLTPGIASLAAMQH